MFFLGVPEVRLQWTAQSSRFGVGGAGQGGAPGHLGFRVLN